MSTVIHFLNGNDESIQLHYSLKEYRDDVIVEINSKFYEVYFFVRDSLEYEMTKDGFFSFPGLIILEEISNEKIYAAISYLVSIGYLVYFISHEEILYEKRFSNKWYQNELSPFKKEAKTSVELDLR